MARIVPALNENFSRISMGERVRTRTDWTDLGSKKKSYHGNAENRLQIWHVRGKIRNDAARSSL